MDLYEALRNARGGETITLPEGHYGFLALGSKSGFNVSFPLPVTIVSENPLRPATFRGMTLHGVKNLILKNLSFKYTFEVGQNDDFRPFEIARGSESVTVDGCKFEGDVAGHGFGTAIALSLRDVSNINISNSVFFQWKRAVVVGNATNISLTGNEVFGVRSDGLNFSAVEGVLIEQNYLHDFRGSYTSGDHRDMIQFWTNGTKTPSKNITIRNNRLDIGAGTFTQSIFMRNEEVDTGRAGPEMFYQNLLIEDNWIYNGHLHGITIGAASGLILRNNRLLTVLDKNNPNKKGTGVWRPSINLAGRSTNVEVLSNIAAAFAPKTRPASWVLKNNLWISPSRYPEFFTPSSLTPQAGVNRFQLK